jgi:cell division protein FtsL
MNNQELLLVVALSVAISTPLIFTAYNLYKIDKWFQRVEQRIDKADKRLK